MTHILTVTSYDLLYNFLEYLVDVICFPRLQIPGCLVGTDTPRLYKHDLEAILCTTRGANRNNYNDFVNCSG